MPRKSVFEKLFDDTKQKLTNIRNKLDPRTYRAYERKIIGTNRKDTLKKINTELDEFRNNVGNENKKFKTSDIKTINKTFDMLNDKVKKISTVKNFNFDLDKIRNLGVSTKQIIKNILKFYNENNNTENKHDKILLSIGGVNYTLNKQTQKRLLKFADNNFITYEDTTESDGAVVTQIIDNPVINFIYVEPVSVYKINTGEFFKYYNNLEKEIFYEKNIVVDYDFDLKDFGIYENKKELYDEVDKVCLVKALRIGGLNDEKYTLLKTIVKNANIPFCKLEELCNILEIQIQVKREKQKNPSRDLFGKEFNEKYTIGLLDEHYFIIKDTPYRSLIEKLYPNNNWTKSVKKDALLDSYNLIKILLSDKQYLVQIPYHDLEDTIYYKLVDDEIVTLNYNKKCCELVEPKIEKITEWVDKNVFFDFETYTDSNGFHIPYLCCICYELNNGDIRQKSFIGEDCGKQMLLYLKKSITVKKTNIQLIAHNANYDYQFIVRYLYDFTELKRGSKMLNARGKFFGTNFKIKCSYHLISTKLSKFGKMFNLSQEKEVMPYAVYNEGFNIFENRNYPIQKIINGVDKNGYKFLKQDEVDLFLHNIKKWKLEKNGCYDIIEYSRRYCEIDCIVLMNGYNTFRKWILELNTIDDNGEDTGISMGLDIDNIITSASLAHTYMINNGCYDGIYKLGGIPQQFIQNCVVGGRTMSCCNEMLDINNGKKIGDFDGVSLYPSAMNRMTGWLKGLPKIIKDCSYENIKNYDGYFVEVLIKNIPLHRNFPLMSYKNKEGIRNFTNDMIGKKVYLDKIMLEDAMTFQGLTENDFEIIRGYYFDEGFNSKINKTITYLFETRKLKKKEKNPIQEIYKLIMNSAYGKSILKEQTTETRYFNNKNEYAVYLDRNYDRVIETIFISNCDTIKVETISSIHEHQNIAQVGVSVLSWSKRIMNEVMCLAEDNKIDMFYQDTDSIHMYQDDINKLSTLFYNKYNRNLVGEELGQFHSDFEIDGCKNVYSSRLIVLGKKCYVDRLVGEDKNGNEKIDYHIRLKGVPNSTIEYEIKNKKMKDVIKLYEEMYKGESIDFDLTEGKGKARFKIQKNFGVKTLENFNRKICFKKK